MALENVSLEEMESLATLSKTLADNPATRRQFLSMVKQASPDTPIPEIDMENRIYQNVKPFVDKITILESQLADRDFKETVKVNREKLNAHGLGDKVSEIEKMMVDNKIGDYDTAAKFYKSTQEASTPTPASFSSPMSMPNMKEMGGDINAWARQAAHEAVNDIVRSRGR